MYTATPRSSSMLSLYGWIDIYTMTKCSSKYYWLWLCKTMFHRSRNIENKCSGISNPLSYTHCSSSILSRTSLGLCWMTATLRQSPRTLTEMSPSFLKGTATATTVKPQHIWHFALHFGSLVSSLTTIDNCVNSCRDPHSLETLWSLLLLRWMLMIHCRWKSIYLFNYTHYYPYSSKYSLRPYV